MKQDTAVDMAMREMLKFGWIDPANYNSIKPYAEWLVGIGFDIGRKAHVTPKPVVQLSLDGKELKVYESVKVASNKTGVFRRDITKVISGKRKSAGGYKWRFVNV
jgi:hypothetical protein